MEKRPGEEVGQRVGSRHGASTSPFVFCWLLLPGGRGGLDSHMKAGVRGRWLSPIRGVNFTVNGFFWTKREFVWPLNPLAPPPHCFCLLTSLRAATTIWTPGTGYPSDWLPEHAKWSGWRVACVAIKLDKSIRYIEVPLYQVSAYKSPCLSAPPALGM